MGSITFLETNDVDLQGTEAQRLNHGLQPKSLPRYPCGAAAIQVMTYNPGCRPGYIHDDLAFEHLAVFKDIQSPPLQTARMTRLP